MKVLKVAGALSAGVAVLHIVIVWWGGPGYRYFGAGEHMARLAEQGSPIPALVTSGLAMVFAVWAAYAFAGAGVIARLPLLRTALLTIGSVYTLRGLLLGPQLVWFVSGHRAAVPLRQLAFSMAALLTGLAYLVGTKLAWAGLARDASRQGG